MTDPPEWRDSRRKRAEVAAIAAVGYPLLLALESTLRWKISGAEHEGAIAKAGHQPIHCLWHGRILPSILYLQHRGVVVIISENYDGEWIARITRKFGYGTARGSTSKGGPKALRQMLREVESKGVAFTLDGPRGPAEIAQLGAVWLAKATGNPLLPFHSEAASNWTLKSWDRTQIPKPFARVVMAVGEPLSVAADADAAALDQASHTLQLRLQDAERACRQALASPDPA